jgi:nuclear transport factor 2 (NTF2) superfamily protein
MDIFLTSDAEKEWRNRDAEFETEEKTKDALLIKWRQELFA